MNLEYPLNESYSAYSHIEIIKLKEKNVAIPFSIENFDHWL